MTKDFMTLMMVAAAALLSRDAAQEGEEGHIFNALAGFVLAFVIFAYGVSVQF